MSTSTAIRDAQRRDASALASLLEQLSEDEGRPRRVSATMMESALFTPQPVELRALIAEGADGGPTACAFYYWGFDTLDGSAGYHVGDVVVARAQRRCGLGRALMASLAAQCLREGGQWLALTVLRDNAAALGFYRALGFTPVAVDYLAMGPKALMRLSG